MYAVYLAGTMVICVMITTCAEIVLRYFFKRPIFWATEITEYCLLYVTFLGTAWLLGKDGHVRIDLLVNRLNPKAQAFVDIVVSLVGAAVSLAFAWYGAKTTWSNFRDHTIIPSILEPPFFIVLAVIPLGSFLLFIQFLRRMFRDLEKRSARGVKGRG